MYTYIYIYTGCSKTHGTNLNSCYQYPNLPMLEKVFVLGIYTCCCTMSFRTHPVYIYIYVYIYVCIYVCICMYVYIYVCIYTSLFDPITLRRSQ